MVLALGQDVNATVRFKHCMSTEYTHSHSQNYHTHKHTHTMSYLVQMTVDLCWKEAWLPFCSITVTLHWGENEVCTHSLLESNWSFSFTWFETTTMAERWLVSILFINKTSFSLFTNRTSFGLFTNRTSFGLFTNRTSFGLFTNKLVSVCLLTKHIVYNSNHWPKHLQSFPSKERSNK